MAGKVSVFSRSAGEVSLLQEETGAGQSSSLGASTAFVWTVVDGERGDVETDLAPHRHSHPGAVVRHTGTGLPGPVVRTTLRVDQPEAEHLAVVLPLAGGEGEELPGGGVEVVAVHSDIAASQQDLVLSVLGRSQSL